MSSRLPHPAGLRILIVLRSARSGCRVLARPLSTLTLLLLLGGGIAAAGQDGSPPSAAAPQPRSNQAPLFLSPEQLANVSKKSVAIISQTGRDGKEAGLGSGFVISTNGLIATCLHVIGEGRPITIRFADGRKFEPEEVYAWDRRLDLAVLRIPETAFPLLPLGNSDALPQGAPVAAMGNPLGYEHSFVQGVVSARREMEHLEMIQLAIPIEPGNSGGPLLSLNGEVQGILNMKSAVTANLGFAIPINALKTLLERPNPVPMARWLKIGSLNPAEWEIRFGARWIRRAGRIEVENPGTGFGGRSLCLSRKPAPEMPYEIEVSVKLDDEAGAAGLAFLADEGETHYGFYPSAGQMRLTRFDGPTVYSWTILQQAPSPHYRPGEWNHIKVRIDPEKTLCYVNHHLAFETADRELAGAQFGLVKFRQTKAQFRNFRFGPVLPGAPPGPAPETLAEIKRLVAAPPPLSETEWIDTLGSHPETSRGLLQERAMALEREAHALRQLAGRVHRTAVQSALVSALDRSEAETDLFHAALLLSKFDNPDLDVEAYREELARMAGEISAQLPSEPSEAAKLAALKDYLFVENGFHGSRGDYYNKANSYLDQVLDGREGLPITLSVLFLELAQRIDLKTIAGVPMPGHFLVKHAPENEPEQLIDVFNGGKLLSRPEAARLFATATGEPFPLDSLQPATKREIILRMIRNLRGALERTQPASQSLPYLDLILALSPDSSVDRLNRAMLRVQTGDRSGAKTDLKWLLERQPAGLDLDRISELYHSL